MAHDANINPEMLRWAREDSGLSAAEVAAALAIKESRGQRPEERYLAIERGAEPLSWSRLKRLADLYRRPLTTFFMRRPPRRSGQIADFRTVADRKPEVEGWLHSLVTRVQARQQELRQLLVDEEAERVAWVGALQSQSSTKDAVGMLRRVIRVSFEDQLAAKGRDQFFSLLRGQAEEAGAFVHLATDLGSWHTQIDPEVFRGFCLADDLAPIIVLNGNDAKAARSFTLIHELAHLAHGETVLSNASPFEDRTEGAPSEQRCNEVAAEFLLPSDAVPDLWSNYAGGSLEEAVEQFARATSVSRAFSARRLSDLRLISKEDWWRLFDKYQGEWQRQRQRQREQEGGPSYYLTTKSKIGDRAIRLVFGALDAGDLSYTRASRILGVNAHAFDGLRAR